MTGSGLHATALIGRGTLIKTEKCLPPAAWDEETERKRGRRVCVCVGVGVEVSEGEKWAFEECNAYGSVGVGC